MRTTGGMLAAALWFATELACAASAGKQPSQSAAKTEEEVIVEARRIELKRRVYDFVSGLTQRGYQVESLCNACPMP